ncbi:hypothetical protein [Picosynechococcus sp. NKBG15041c]|uniref:hypothetical protein n=1 Tax=Picosynechococcus sp. NKBG15041c TaxID=1407650 RepID=UPI000423D7BD|nr:hypothetical protein [Picosynechococcus sp. NKBG15041c]
MYTFTYESAQFGQELSHQFAIESAGARYSEVQQFRALMSAFGKISPRFLVEEYHGQKHQVYFNGSGSWGRSPARCELCDVVILAYSYTSGFRARVTFLQAKRSTEFHAGVCSSFPSEADELSFKANLEQWDLLSRRPEVLPVPPLIAQPHILQAAILSSVGSFGVFHRGSRKDVGFFYASADQLQPVAQGKTKFGRLKLPAASPLTRTIGGYKERIYCCCLPLFGAALYELEIGTPIEPASDHIARGPGKSSLRAWVRGLLRFYVEHSIQRSDTLQEILNGLVDDEQEEIEFFESAPSLLVVKSNMDAGENDF